MKSKSRILLISTIIIFILTIFIGTSYSLWQTINTQDSVNTATTKCFNVEITSQKNSISLENAYPISNVSGKKLSDYDATMEDLDNEIKSIVTYLDTKRSLFDFFLFYYLSLNDFITITFYCKRIITFWTFNRMRPLF